MPRTDAAVLATRRYTLGQSSIGFRTDYTGVTFRLIAPYEPSGSMSADGVFGANFLTPAHSGGTILVSTAMNDALFAAAATALTNGRIDPVAASWRWGPSTDGFGGTSDFEKGFFGLATTDLKGSAIRSLALQVNLVDIVHGIDPKTGASRDDYRMDATIIVSDSETVAPVLPVAIAGGASEWRLLAGENLLLDASNSLGDITKYAWDLNRDGADDFVSGSPQLLLTPAEYAPYLIADGKPHSVLLRVTDSAGGTSTNNYQRLTYVPEPGVGGVALLTLGVTYRWRRSR